jgi:hypothetical protein
MGAMERMDSTHSGRVDIPISAIVELTDRGENDLYLRFRISHPRHGTDPQESIAALRRARARMEHGLPQVGPGYLLSVTGQDLLLSDDGPILGIGVYGRQDVPVAVPRLADALESEGWSGVVTIVDREERRGATYVPDDRVHVPENPVSEVVFGAPRPPVAAPVPGRVVVDEARIEHSWQEGMDTAYGWLRLHCPADTLPSAALSMANGIGAVAQRHGVNTTDAGEDDCVMLGPVQVSAQGPFVSLDDIGDFTRFRAVVRVVRELAGYLEDDGVEGVLTILDFREGRP